MNSPTRRPMNSYYRPPTRLATEDRAMTTTYDPALYLADAAELRRTIPLIDNPAQLISDFYGEWFRRTPGVRGMFPAEMNQQVDKLLGAVVALAQNYHQREAIIETVRAWGRIHAARGTTIAQFDIVGDLLLWALERHVPAVEWTPAAIGAWTRAYCWAAGQMILAAADVELQR